MSQNDFPPLDLPTVEDSTVLFDGFGQLRCDRLRLPNKELYDYYTFITTAEAVMIVAETESGDLVINREYRHPTGQVLLGLPGGLITEGESPEEGARRELMEETGFTADSFEQIGRAFPFPGASSQSLIFMYAKNARKIAEPSLEGAEILNSHVMSELQMRARIDAGDPVDGALCMALFFFRTHSSQRV